MADRVGIEWMIARRPPRDRNRSVSQVRMLRRLFKSLMLTPPVDDEIDEIARFQISENAAFLTPAGAYAPTYPRSKSVRRIEGKNAIMRRIDGHPDIHEYLWDRAGADIPRECCWVIRATATFANPETNIIFAASGGTHGIRIRMSEENASPFPGYTDPSSDHTGFRWLQSRLKLDDDRAMLAMAYEDSKTLTRDRTKR
ncbi:MAG TPA: hypothetical protein VMM76_27130 [Pirellulaceae bacterium]|nr:hypothetical protein [Pirellulaceae bacterium]